MITKKYYKLIRVSHADEGYFYIKNVSNETGDFKFVERAGGSMEYSLDGVTWTSYDFTTKPTVQVGSNTSIYFRGTGYRAIYTQGNPVFNFNKDYIVGGNYMSISNYATMSSVTEITSSNLVMCTFYNQTHLISAADLNFGNVTTISANEGLKNVFSGCSSLTEIPDFSNITTVGQECFDSCFRNCASLTNGGDFSNITSAGSSSFSSCYSGCTHISNVIAPNIQDLTQNGVLSNWLDNAGTSATGTKVVNVPTGATITTNSINGIPSGWTRVDY